MWRGQPRERATIAVSEPRASVAEPEHEDAGLDLFGREQVEAAGLLPKIHLCSGRGNERDVGQSVAKRGVACLVEGGEPIVEEMAGGGVWDQAHLVAEAGQVNDNEGVNGADVVPPSRGHRSVSGITEDDGVDLGWIIFLVGGWRSRCGAGGTGSARAAGGKMCMSVVSQGIENREERTGGGNGSKQDGSRAERLAPGDIEARSGESGGFGGEALLHGWVVHGCSRGGPGRRRSGGVGRHS